MAKFYGKVGFVNNVETRPGIYVEEVTERFYYGDVVRNTRRLQSTDQVNDNVTISNEISIVSDPYADSNFHSIRYVEFMGAKCKATVAEVKYPRLILTVGGLYNG
jgi:hypothetical protein